MTGEQFVKLCYEEKKTILAEYFNPNSSSVVGKKISAITEQGISNRDSHHPNISPVISGYKQPSKSAQSIEITGFIEKSKPPEIIFFYTLLPLTA